MTTTSGQTIAAQAEALSASMAQQAPGGLLSAFAAEQAELIAAGVPADAAKPGATVPDVELLDARGAATTLRAVADGKPYVLVTYRGVWGPYCNVALKTYQEQLVPVLAERGITLIAVSPQKPDSSAAMREKNGLTYPAVSDPGNKLATALGVATAPTPGALESLHKLGVDVESINADGTANVPMPTVAIVDADHTLRWIDVHPDYTTRTEVAEVVAALDTLS